MHSHTWVILNTSYLTPLSCIHLCHLDAVGCAHFKTRGQPSWYRGDGCIKVRWTTMSNIKWANDKKTQNVAVHAVSWKWHDELNVENRKSKSNSFGLLSFVDHKQGFHIVLKLSLQLDEMTSVIPQNVSCCHTHTVILVFSNIPLTEFVFLGKLMLITLNLFFFSKTNETLY